MKLESGGGNRDHIYNTTAQTVSVFHLRLTQFVRTVSADNVTFRCPDGRVIHYTLHLFQGNKRAVSSLVVFS